MYNDTIPMEFVGGSRDGEAIDAKNAPDYYEVYVNPEITEIYERQNKKPPFIYLKVGYAKREFWM